MAHGVTATASIMARNAAECPGFMRYLASRTCRLPTRAVGDTARCYISRPLAISTPKCRQDLANHWQKNQGSLNAPDRDREIQVLGQSRTCFRVKCPRPARPSRPHRAQTARAGTPRRSAPSESPRASSTGIREFRNKLHGLADAGSTDTANATAAAGGFCRVESGPRLQASRIRALTHSTAGCIRRVTAPVTA